MLRVGLAGAGVLALAGSGVWMWRPAWQGTALTEAGQTLFVAVADAVLDGLLPADSGPRAASLQLWQADFTATVAALPPALQSEVHQLGALLASPPGRRFVVGLSADWGQASRAEVSAALQQMRLASSDLRQQAYHALRDLAAAAYFSNPERWPQLGYPGQLVLEPKA